MKKTILLFISAVSVSLAQIAPTTETSLFPVVTSFSSSDSVRIIGSSSTISNAITVPNFSLSLLPILNGTSSNLVSGNSLKLGGLLPSAYVSSTNGTLVYPSVTGTGGLMLLQTGTTTLTGSNGTLLVNGSPITGGGSSFVSSTPNFVNLQPLTSGTIPVGANGWTVSCLTGTTTVGGVTFTAGLSDGDDNMVSTTSIVITTGTGSTATYYYGQ